MLERRELDFMDKIGKDALFSTGHRLTYNDILKGLLDVAIETGLSGRDIDSLETFKQKLLEQIRALMEEEAKKKEGLK
jgi:hypothetical protein